MKVIRHLTLFLATLMILSSCKEDNFDIEPTLEVAQNTLSFSKNVETKSIDVKINEGDEFYHAITSTNGTDWIDVTKTATGLSVSVTENIAEEPREATIKVTIRKGSLAETITVTQGDGSYIRASEEKIDIKYQGGETILYVECSSTWTFTLDGGEDWLSIDDTDIAKNKLKIVALENTEVKSKAAEITLINAGLEECIVTVNQYGLPHYDFPLYDEMGYIYEGAESERGLKHPESLFHAHVFEKERDSKFESVFGSYRHIFKSKSAILSHVCYNVYQFATFRRDAVRSTLALDLDNTRALTLQNDPEFLEYVEDKGFEFAWKSTPDSVTTYWHPEKQVALQILHPTSFTREKGLTFIHSRLRPNDPVNQADSRPTYSALPQIFMEWGATVAQIMAWEEANGGKFMDESSDEVLSFYNSDVDIIERVYYMDAGSLIQVMLLMTNMEKVLYHTGSYNEFYSYVMTREFTNLLKNNGYVFDRETVGPTTFFFKNTEKQSMYLVQLLRFDTEGIIPRVCLTILPTPQP